MDGQSEADSAKARGGLRSYRDLRKIPWHLADAAMSRATTLAFVLLCASALGVVFGAMHLIQRDRAELVTEFSNERLVQVEQAARIMDDDLIDVTEAIRFAGRSAARASSLDEAGRELSALVSVAAQYRLVQIFVGNRRVLSIAAPDDAAGADARAPQVAAAIDDAVLSALARPDEPVTTPPILTSAQGWYRVFAATFGRPDAGSALRTASAGSTKPDDYAVVAMLVDTDPLFRKLRLVAPSADSRLLLLGPRGNAAPVSDAALSEALARLEAGARDLPVYAEVVERMKQAKRGTLQMDSIEAQRLGLGPAPAIAAYAAVPNRAGGYWSITTLNSLASLEAHQRALVWRLGLASGGIVALLIGFGAYVLVASRRAVAVRERLRHAEELAQLHEKTNKILDTIPTGVMVLSDDERITQVNRALRARIPSGVIGGSLRDAFPHSQEAMRERLAALVARARREGRVCGLHGERGALFEGMGEYSLYAVPLEPAFPEARSLLVVEDLTEVRSLATQLVRAEKLATVGVLAAGIAHEVGTPLGVVRGRAEYVIGKLGSDHAQAASVRVIVEQIDLVTRTIRKLLDFSRVRPSVVQPVAVAPVAHAVADLLRFEAERRKLTLVVDVPSTVATVAANPDELQQVLVNLVMNACDACPPGGHVAIRSLSEVPDAAPSRGHVRIEVVDDGRGIPEEQRAQVFDPFFTTKKRGQGTGLGLTIVAQIVRNHGGQIEIDSDLGRGTRVTLLWPTALAREEHHVATT